MSSANHIRVSGIARSLPKSATAKGIDVAKVCPLCGSHETRFAFAENHVALRTCCHCDLFFVSPYPASESQHVRVASGSQARIEILDLQRRYQGEKLYYGRHFPLIAEECTGAKFLLDVGCGAGHLLERLASQPGLYRVGIELNPQAAQFARRTAGCEIIETPFEKFQAARRFDVITLINVFSHIPSFERMFYALRESLQPGGKVVLRTTEMAPNVHRWSQLHWGIPDDIHFLGLRTLDLLAQKYGFTVTRRICTPYDDELFLPSRWRQTGRSRLVNLAKIAGLRTPFALPALKKLYTRTFGGRLFLSFIVLRPISNGN